MPLPWKRRILGGQSFRLGVHDALGGAQAYAVIFIAPPGGPGVSPRRMFPVGLEAGGYGTWHWEVPSDPVLVGLNFHVQWLVSDPGAPARFARSEAVRFTIL